MNPFADGVANEKYRDLLSISQEQRLSGFAQDAQSLGYNKSSSWFNQLKKSLGNTLHFRAKARKSEKERVQPFRRVL